MRGIGENGSLVIVLFLKRDDSSLNIIKSMSVIIVLDLNLDSDKLWLDFFNDNLY